MRAATPAMEKRSTVRCVSSAIGSFKAGDGWDPISCLSPRPDVYVDGIRARNGSAKNHFDGSFRVCDGRASAPIGVVTGTARLELLGVTLGALCIGGVITRGNLAPPEGSLIETATFNGSIGMFVLTLAALLPGVGWTRRGVAAGRVLMVGAIVYAYGIETIQAFRGLDPRFSRSP